jgi:AraC-like DNA-binding protein
VNDLSLSQQELVSLVPLPGWIRAAVRCGFAIAPMLRDIGIPVVDSGAQGVVITQKQSFRLMEACVAQARGEHFPFVFGENCVLESIPEIQTYVCSCETLRDAIKSYNWVRDLMSNGVNISLHETETYAYIRINIGNARVRTDAAIFFTETLITSVIKLITQLVGRKDVERLTFRHAPPDYSAAYAKFFGVPVQFDQVTDAVVIRTELLDRPLNGAVPELHQQAKAQILHQTFADVQSQSRFQKTCSLLRNTDCSVNEISERLGFSDRRAFTRAFKRWSNVSPSCYRERL